MAWTSPPRTWTTGEIVTASILNTHVRDQFKETAPAKASTAGHFIRVTGSNAIEEADPEDGAKLDGDHLDIDWTPSSYTPDSSPSEAADADDLTAHLKGIDTQLGQTVTVTRDTFSNRPAAGNSGSLFISTDGVGGTGDLEALYRDNGSSWDLIGVWPSSDTYHARIATGTYTGDGATSQVVDTGLGIQLKMVIITQRLTGTEGATNRAALFTTDQIVDDNANGQAMEWSDAGMANDAITALSSDGKFTVDDNGADNHPNANGQTYNYLVIG